MTLKGNADRYGWLIIALHWISAAAILALLVLGFGAAKGAHTEQQAAFLRLHVPLGILVFGLTLFRAAWWFVDRRPGHPLGQPRWQTLAAHTVHTLLYVLILVMGTSGIALMILSGAGNVLFLGKPGPLPEFFDLPPMAVHAGGAFAIMALLCLHVGAALYHQFYRRDRLLARMGIGSTVRK